MKEIVRVFFNHKAFPNCCMVVLKEKETTKYETKENVTVLYNEDEIIGYNITDEVFSKYKYENFYTTQSKHGFTLTDNLGEITATITTTITVFARTGGKSDRVGKSRNQCTTSKERVTFPNG